MFPAAYGMAERQLPHVKIPVGFLPQVPLQSLQECIGILLRFIDGVTRVLWTRRDADSNWGKTSRAVFALKSITVDGAEEFWLAGLRANGLFSCDRCKLPSTLWMEPVMDARRRRTLRRTIEKDRAIITEVGAILRDRPLGQVGGP